VVGPEREWLLRSFRKKGTWHGGFAGLVKGQYSRKSKMPVTLLALAAQGNNSTITSYTPSNKHDTPA
jgi:hypothetical protein